MFGTTAGITAVATTAGNWVYQGGKWIWQTVKANKEDQARKAAQLHVQVRDENRAWWANLQAQARAYQNRVITSSATIPGSATQLGLGQDRARAYGGQLRIEHIVIGGAVLFLLVKK